METLQQLTSIHKQERDIDRFRSSFRGYGLEECLIIRDAYQRDLLADIQFEIDNGRSYLIPLLEELTDEFKNRI
tara:strand:+ start:1042 stop:1263 length:222 start_codon:yes stop_codon:yes gene_type:complete